VGDGFTVKTNQGNVPTRSVLLAIGRRGTRASWACRARSCPRWSTADNPDASTRVSTYWWSAGGDSALEAREHCRGPAAARRGAVLPRAEFDAQGAYRERINAGAKNGSFSHDESNVKQIDAESVSIEKNGADSPRSATMRSS